MQDISKFIAGLPKAELHLHLEGSLEPEQMFMFASRNQIDIPFKSVDEIRKAYDFSNLQDFLDIYYTGMNVLKTHDDFYDLTAAYLKRVSEDNTKHVEVFFDPQGHTDRGIPFKTVITSISSALTTVGAELGISHNLILCFLRHLSEAQAIKTLKDSEKFLHLFHGVGLDSSELGNPPSKFQNVFRMAKDLGLKCVAHAGEEGPSGYVIEALDLLNIDRIDHGNRCLDDPALVKRIAKDKITLTVCPLSNLKLCVIDNMSDHPIKLMLKHNLRATVNSDDPAYFGGYLNENYLAVSEALELTIDDLTVLAKNSFKGSFLGEEEIVQHLKTIDSYVASFSS